MPLDIDEPRADLTEQDRAGLEAFQLFLDKRPPGPWMSPHWQETRDGPVGVPYIILDKLAREVASATVNIVQRPAGSGEETDEDRLYAGVQRANVVGQQEQDEEWEPVPSNHPARELFEYPNEQDSIGKILYQHVFQWGMTGSSYEWCPLNHFEEPSRIFNIPTALTFPLPVTPRYPNGAWRILPPTSLGAYATMYFGATPAGVPVPAEEMVVDRNPHPWVVWDGYSRFQAAANQVDALKQIDIMRSAAAQNGVEPSMVILGPPGMTPEDARRLESRVNERYSGPYNMRKVMVLSAKSMGANVKDGDVSLVPWGRGPNETGGQEAWEQLAGFCSALWGVPLTVCGLKTATTYAEWFAAQKQFHTSTLIPLAKQIAQLWSWFLLWPFYGRNLRIQLDVPKIDDQEQTRADYELMGRLGSVSHNEIRKSRGLKAVDDPDMDTPIWKLTQRNTMEAEKLKAETAKATASMKGPENERPDNPDGKGSLPNRIAPHMNGVPKSLVAGLAGQVLRAESNGTQSAEMRSDHEPVQFRTDAELDQNHESSVVSSNGREHAAGDSDSSS